MKKQMFAVLLAALLLLTACAAPAQTATAPTEAPAATEAPAPAEAPTPEPEPAEYQLEREAGCNQLSIYWTKDKFNIDTSDMWIWFKDSLTQRVPRHGWGECVQVTPVSIGGA